MPYECLLSQDRVNCQVLVRRLRDVRPEKPVVAFVGAGLSTFLGYPLWDELVGRLVEKACLTGPDATTGGHLGIADKCREELGSAEYYSFLRELFPWDPPVPISEGQPYLAHHLDILRTNFSFFLTTNYDAVFDHASNANVTMDLLPSDPLWRLQDLEPAVIDDARRRVVHVHGRLYNTQGEVVDDEVTLTASDYQRAYGQAGQYDGAVSALLWRVLQERTVVFIGCGFEDPEIQGHITATRRQANLQGSDGRHFALVPVAHPAAPHPGYAGKTPEFWDGRLRPLGIMPLRYSVREGDLVHVALGTFLRRLASTAPYRGVAVGYADGAGVPA